MFLIVPSETLKDKDDERKTKETFPLPCQNPKKFFIKVKTTKIREGSTYLDQWVNPLLCPTMHEKVSLLSSQSHTTAVEQNEC